MASEQIHIIKTSDRSFVEIRNLPPSRAVNDDKTVQIHSAIGGSGIMQRLSRETVIELIAALAEAAGVEQDIVRLYFPVTDEEWAERTS